MIPKDPNMLLSFINMKLRDNDVTLQDFCMDEDIDIHEIEEKLLTIGYEYYKDTNQFIAK